MGKKRVSITIDLDVYTRAKELGLNISGVTERSLRAYVQALASPTEQDVTPHITTDTSEIDVEETDAVATRVAQTSGSVDEILEAYTHYGTTVLNRSTATLDQHRRYVGRLLRYTDTSPGAMAEADLIAYLESEEPMSDSKRKNILSAFRVFFGEFVESDVAEGFEIPTMSPNPTQVPTKDELQTFYTAIENPKYRVIFLMYATSGLRSGELVGLTIDDINEADRMLIPENESDVKQTWVSFYNEEAKQAYEAFKPTRTTGDKRLFQASKATVNTTFQRISEQSGVKITPQMLRRWFASEMASLGVDSSYIDAFCGRTPDSVLEKHYLDYSPRKLKQIYDDANLTVLE